MRDPYAVLGVAADADAAEIRRAYRVLAKRLHPDRNPGDAAAEVAFKELTQAFALLADPARRAAWGRGEGDDAVTETRVAGGSPFEELYGEASPAGFHARQPRPGQDFTYRVRVPFLLAALGGRQRVRLAGDRDQDLEIPAGLTDGEILRLPGLGLPGEQGGPPGDALVEVTVEPHAHFRREGADLRLELPVTPAEALNGAVVRLPTLTGPVAMKVPPGSNSGTLLRLKGRGLARRPDAPGEASGSHGDLFVRLAVVLPPEPDSELRLFLAGWCAQHPYDPRLGLFEEPPRGD